VRRTSCILGQQLLDDPGEAMCQLVDEAQVSRVMHLFDRGSIGAPGFLGQLVQKQIQQPRLVEQPHLREILDFRFQVHDGKKSIGLVVVTLSTSLASKWNKRTRATILLSRSGSFSSLETTRHIVTSPEGSIVNSSTSLPCSSARSRSARL